MLTKLAMAVEHFYARRAWLQLAQTAQARKPMPRLPRSDETLTGNSVLQFSWLKAQQTKETAA
jgi:hypothetical protein